MILRYVVVGLAAGALLGALAVYLALRWYREQTDFAAGGSGTGRIVASDTGVEASILVRDPELGLRGLIISWNSRSQATRFSCLWS